MSKLSIKLGDITFRAVFFVLIFAYVAAKCICFCIKHAGRVVFAILPAWVFFKKSFRVQKIGNVELRFLPTSLKNRYILEKEPQFLAYSIYNMVLLPITLVIFVNYLRKKVSPYLR
jgi:hypothetical protein